MRRSILLGASFVPVCAFVGWTRTTNNPSARYYSDDQAKRGKADYNQNCSKCHMENLKGAGSAPALVGYGLKHDYYCVDDLFRKVSLTRPGDNVHGLSPETYINIVAYLLQSNGWPAGKQDLKNDENTMKTMLLVEHSSAKGNGSNAMSSNGEEESVFTQEQADRGKAYFHWACGMCHMVDVSGRAATQAELDSGSGSIVGSRRSLTNFVGDRFRQRWNNVGSLYNKIRTNMPGYDGGGLSPQEYVDIIAYLLQANGWRAGQEELRASIIPNLELDENRFARLFNGEYLSEFKFVLGSNCMPRPTGCAQTDPGTTFKVEDGAVFCSGRPQGYMYTKKKYLNFDFRVEYRFLPYEGMESDDQFYGNSGYLIFMTDHHLVWPKMIEIQGMNSSVLSIIPADIKAKFTRSCCIT